MNLYIKLCHGIIQLLITLSLVATTVFASPATPVKWPELADHLQRQGVVIESMPVVDCPVAIDEESAEHLVCQIIENTFYKWKEYEFYNAAGEVQLAIEMIKPEAHRLTAAAAGVLLNASKQLVRQNVRSASNFMARQPPNEPRLAYLPVYSEPSRSSVNVAEPEISVNSKTALPGNWSNSFFINEFQRSASGIIGSDDRVRVTSIATITDYPWNTICEVDTSGPEEDFRGSGILIAPYCVLTNAHIVLDTSGWMQNVSVSPALHQDYEGNYWIEYGKVAAADLSTNKHYFEAGGFEYDYGAVMLSQRFPQISTFMPIEYDATPNVIKHAGYPVEVQGEINSWDMWYASGNVTGYIGTDDRIMLLDIDMTGGQSGGPIWTNDATTGSHRLVALASLVCPVGNGATRLVSVMEPLISEWMQYDPDDSYDSFSYIPYFSVTDYRWTGIALANYNDRGTEFKIDYYRNDGLPLGSEVKSINAFGQIAFAIDKEVGSYDGWVKISSTAPLTGLALIGDSENAAMFDIDLKNSLHRKFLCPHLAVNDDWRSFVMICNPNDTETEISYTYYDSDGSQVARKTAPPIQAYESINQSLFDLFQQELNGGTLVIETVQPVTAFLLYDNKSTTWKAGLSAVPVD